MVEIGPDTHATLRYALAPDDQARRALDETVAAYTRMGRLLAELPADTGRNLVTLHERAYERIRDETGLPSRLVTLGLRDFTARRGGGPEAGLPLDEKLFSIKGPTILSVATILGRATVPYDVAGYAPGWDAVFPARLVQRDGRYEIHVGVVRRTTQEEVTMQDGVLSRMGRLIAGIANATIDKVEDANKVTLVEQAIREIDQAAEQARADLGKAKAEEYRVKSRKSEIGADLASLDGKLKLALSENRDDLAKAAISRQIDLEAQVTALDRTLADVKSDIDEGQQALQAVLATRREAEARLADLKRSLAQHEAPEASGGRGRKSATQGSARAAAAIARVTGVPSGASAQGAELDELDRLHRERSIAERLALAKGQR